jgi:large exoprotein involved in heme utilization and adhesion
VQHQGIGNAGQLSINTNTLHLTNQGRILAATASGEGGNVLLNARQNLLLRDRSQVTTTSNGNGNGGNIRINSNVLVGINDSDIIAQARSGRGGNIAIDADAVLGITPRPDLTSASDINASSQLGLSGTINITNPNVNLDANLIALPAELLDSSQQVAQTCARSQNSTFITTGRGGIPSNPLQTVDSDRPWSDLRDLMLETTASSQAIPTVPAPFVEATGLYRHPTTGRVELVEAKPVQPEISAICSRESRRLSGVNQRSPRRYEAYSGHSQMDETAQPISFSMSSYKRLAFNDHLLSRFISMLDLDSTLIKSHPNYEKLRSYGIVYS